MIVTIGWLTLADPAIATEPDFGDWKQDEVAGELIALDKEYLRLYEEWDKSIPDNDGAAFADATISDEDWLKQAQEESDRHPDTRLLPRYLAIAEQHSDSPFALDALIFVIGRGGPSTGNVHGKSWELKEQAIDIVAKEHLDDPRVAYVFDQLAGALPSDKTEAFLRTAFTKAPDRATRAAAGYHLAQYLHHIHHVHRRSALLAKKEHLMNYERYWTLAVTPYLERNFPYDRERLLAQTEQVLNRVADEFSEIPVADWKVEGPRRIFIRPATTATHKTYGELARSLLWSIRNVVPGKRAPEIEGIDAAGKRFRLSDYRGRVVLLTFSANWCGGCVELYPLQRKLIQKLRAKPFALLSVSADEKVETLKASTELGEITWRCWWDGQDGPITQAWNNPGFPTIFLLDHDHVIQDLPLNRFSIEQAISDLLRKTARVK
jgi:thiol-disulfide isomerase/thioredoxin